MFPELQRLCSLIHSESKSRKFNIGSCTHFSLVKCSLFSCDFSCDHTKPLSFAYIEKDVLSGSLSKGIILIFGHI